MATAELIDKSLRNHVVDHVLKGVDATPLLEDPFPHVLIHGFFPADVYAQLVKCLPPDNTYEAVSYDKHTSQDGQSNRGKFSLKNAKLEQLSPQAQQLWITIRSVLAGPELKTAIYSKLRSGLAFRNGINPSKVDSLPGFALPELYRETENYRITPHPDTRKKVVTMQIALAKDDSQVDLGTEFYRRSLRPSSWLREPKGFDIVRTMPFLPNTTYAFVVLNTITLKSWHGRSTLQPMCGVRNSILNIWYTNAKSANPEIFEDLQNLSLKSRAA